MSDRDFSVSDPYARGMMAAKTNEWNTPPEVLAPVYRFFGGVVLDPCSNSTSLVHCARSYNLALSGEDGLELTWAIPGFKAPTAFVNPPYGGEIHPWLVKAIAEATHRGVSSLVLIPASTCLEWWQNFAVQASAMCFWNGRIKFIDSSKPGSKRNSAFFSSAMLYYHGKSARFLSEGVAIKRFRTCFEEYGWIVTP